MTLDPLLTRDEDLSADIIGINEYAPEEPQKKDFLPWHKPRKQFVRQKQWCVQIEKMIEESTPENNVLKYLGLPGDDLLDLRYFYKNICEPKNINLRFLGFNHGANSSKNGANLNISLDEVNRLSLVDPNSQILSDDICQIANTKSLAWERSRRMGPFDVINIDLCDGFGSQPHDKLQQTHYDALNQLMALQARRANPWLLLLTTRSGPDHTDKSVFDILKKLYGQNLLTCDTFKNLSNTVFTIFDENSLEDASKLPKTNSAIFLISLCKWLAKISIGQNPPSKIELKSVIGYKVAEKADYQDLVSLAIRIEPTLSAANDLIGLANQQQIVLDECAIAVQILNKVSNMRDADAILEENDDLKEEMISITSSLLEEARYDITGYSEWARRI